ncbi:MAG: aminotransferase class III-fold pyridoxal phosphate-dependent enzyme [Firmicutes bacterium]|nr:aminotransferase class III-fold pyridoxal phosphate-dependent enzyme [Bacillota bacterium]
MIEDIEGISIEEADKLVEETLDKYERYVNPGFAQLMRILGTTLEVKTEGAYMYDVYGHKYLDFLSGHGVYNLGYCHPKVVKAVEDQIKRIAQTSARTILNKPMADLCELLAKVTPGELTYTFLCNSGTEAVEGSLKLARAATGKTQIIAADNAFHGKSLGSLSATGRPAYREPFKPLIPEVDHVPFGDINSLRAAINDNTAAVILEPVQGEGGVNVPPSGYLRAVRQLCDETGVLLILDEVQTGFGRTGKMFACEHEGVTPDIMALAKALGGGVMPIGAFIATPKAFAPFVADPLLHTSTFGGNPLACAAAIATINVILEEDLPKQATEKGEYMLSKLYKLKEDYPDVLKDVRGQGLLIGIEFADEGLAGSTIYELEQEYILVLHMLNNPKVVRLEPPLIITYEQIDFMLSSLKRAMEQARTLL